MLLNEIALATSTSTVSVKKVLLHFGIDYSKILKDDYDLRISKVIPMYLEGNSQVVIEKELKLTRKTIRTILKNTDLKYRTKSEQSFIRYETEIDETVFDILTPDALYWIGMLYSDGHIEQQREASVALVLHNNDINHLEKFKLFLKSNRPIAPDHGDCSRMRFNSIKIRDRLVDLGFTQNKSVTIYPHEFLKYSRDFWRCVVDGDGGVYIFKNKAYTASDTVTLCGTEKTIIMFINLCVNFSNVKQKTPTKNLGKNLYSVSYYGQDAIKVLNLLYKDSTTYLERKYQTYQEIIKTN